MRELCLDHAELGALAEEILGRGGRLCFRARGTSMMPAVTDGDLLTLGPIGAGGPEIGDIVLARTEGGRLVVHRVRRLERQGERLLVALAGDAATFEERAPVWQVLGRVVSHQRRGDHRATAAGWQAAFSALWRSVRDASGRVLARLQRLRP